MELRVGRPLRPTVSPVTPKDTKLSSPRGERGAGRTQHGGSWRVWGPLCAGTAGRWGFPRPQRSPSHPGYGGWPPGGFSAYRAWCGHSARWAPRGRGRPGAAGCLSSGLQPPSRAEASSASPGAPPAPSSRPAETAGRSGYPHRPTPRPLPSQPTSPPRAGAAAGPPAAGAPPDGLRVPFNVQDL